MFTRSLKLRLWSQSFVVLAVLLSIATVPYQAQAQVVPTIINIDAYVHEIRFSPDEQAFVAYSAGFGLYKYDATTGALVSSLDIQNGSSPLSDLMLIRQEDGSWGLVNLWASDEFIVSEFDNAEINEPLYHSIISDDGTFLAVPPFDGIRTMGNYVMIYDISSGHPQPMTILEDPSVPSTVTLILYPIFTPDSTQLIAVEADYRYSNANLVVWDIETGAIVQKFAIAVREPSMSYYRGIIYSPDRTQVIDTSSNLWDIATGNKLMTFGDGYDLLGGMVFAGDNSSILAVRSGYQQNTEVQFIDTSTGNVVNTIASYAYAEGSLYSSFGAVGIRPDRRYVVAASRSRDGNALLLWDLDATASSESACVLTTRLDVAPRSQPDMTAAQSNLISQGSQVEANGQFQATNGFLWYRLTDMTWLRAEQVDTTPECTSLPTVNP